LTSHNCFCSSRRSDMWVVQSGFTGHSARHLDLWNPILSKSSTQLNQPFELAGSDGSMLVKGIQYIDRVTITRWNVCFSTIAYEHDH
jgi:hypothetical protein